MLEGSLARALLGPLAAAGCGGARAPEADSSVPLITLDTTRADALSILGAEPGATPRLDRLAESGALFTQARSETNSTTPSHVTIFTGRRAIDHGVMNNATALPDAVRTLIEVLSEAGYRAAGFVAVRHFAAAMNWRGFDDLPDVEGVATAR